MRAAFAQAAELLSSARQIELGEVPDGLAKLLDEVGQFDALMEPPGSAVRNNAARLLAAAALMPRMFKLHSQYAPELVFLGGEADPGTLGASFLPCPSASVSGSGANLAAAFVSCVGEAVEYLSQVATETDFVAPGPGIELVDPAQGYVPDADLPGRDRFVAARDLHSGSEVALPAWRCLRFAPGTDLAPPITLSTGCGAGPTFEQAALHGLLELLERDAVSRWWQAGIPGRLLPGDDAAIAEAYAYLASLRGGASLRHTWFLDITTELGVPAVAALSADENGRRLSCGSASALDLAGAVRAAGRELCQMELAYDVIDAKLEERGEAGLNDIDRRHLARGELDVFDPSFPLYPGRPPAHPSEFVTVAQTAPQALADLVGHLTASGERVLAVDLTRDVLGIPVVRVVAPTLQPYPSQIVTQRLRDALKESGYNPPSLAIM